MHAEPRPLATEFHFVKWGELSFLATVLISIETHFQRMKLRRDKFPVRYTNLHQGVYSEKRTFVAMRLYISSMKSTGNYNYEDKNPSGEYCLHLDRIYDRCFLQRLLIWPHRALALTIPIYLDLQQPKTFGCTIFFAGAVSVR